MTKKPFWVQTTNGDYVPGMLAKGAEGGLGGAELLYHLAQGIDGVVDATVDNHFDDDGESNTKLQKTTTKLQKTTSGQVIQRTKVLIDSVGLITRGDWSVRAVIWSDSIPIDSPLDTAGGHLYGNPNMPVSPIRSHKVN
jgi:hypothetical protein